MYSTGDWQRMLGVACSVCLAACVMQARAQSQNRSAEKTETPTAQTDNAGGRRVDSGSADQVAQSAALHTLGKRVDQVDWDDITFEDFVEWLEDQGSVNVVADYNALGVAGIERESLLSLKLTRLTVAEVLEEVILQLDRDGSGEIAYRASGNVIRISTRRAFNRKLFLRTYDITDLLFRVPGFVDGPTVELEQAQQATQAGGATPPALTAAGQGSNNEPQQGDNNQRDIEQIERLSRLIEQTVEPDHWEPRGGKGRIRHYNNALVIRASLEVHEQIAGQFALDE